MGHGVVRNYFPLRKNHRESWWNMAAEECKHPLSISRRRVLLWVNKQRFTIATLLYFIISTSLCSTIFSIGLTGCLHEKTRPGECYIPGLLDRNFVSCLHHAYFISYRACREAHLTLINTRHFGLTKFTHALPVQVHPDVKFLAYMTLMQDFAREWNSRSGTETGVKSRRYDIFW